MPNDEIRVTPDGKGGYRTNRAGTGATPEGGQVRVDSGNNSTRVDPKTGQTDRPGVTAEPDHKGGFFLPLSGSAGAIGAGGILAGPLACPILVGISFFLSTQMLPICGPFIFGPIWLFSLYMAIKKRHEKKKLLVWGLIFILSTSMLIGSIFTAIYLYLVITNPEAAKQINTFTNQVTHSTFYYAFVCVASSLYCATAAVGIIYFANKLRKK